MSRLSTWLDNRLFPAIIRFATNRYHIGGLTLLWIALLVFAGFTTFALLGGNYFNGLCGLCSCILLAQQGKHHAEVKQLHAENQMRHDVHAAQLTDLHEQVKRLVDAQKEPQS